MKKFTKSLHFRAKVLFFVYLCSINIDAESLILFKGNHENTFSPAVSQNVYCSGNWFIKCDKALGKLLELKPVLTETSKTLVDKVEAIARTNYDNLSGEPLRLSVKNGNKEFAFRFNNSAWHRISLTKKGEEISDFEILHVKGDKSYDFYSTGGYPSRIIGKKCIAKFNEMLEKWMPRLI